MRYDSELLEIYVVISGNGLLFKDIKLGLGLLITARKMHAQFRENRYLEMSATTNNLRPHLYGLGYPRQPSPRVTLDEVTSSLFLCKINHITLGLQTRLGRRVNSGGRIVSPRRVG